MTMHHTQALILKKDERGEADWMITALTRDFGKIRLRAQGARKHGAKLQGHLEPGFLAEISFVIGRNGYRLTTARLKEFFPASRRSSEKLQALFMALRSLDVELLEERDSASHLFAMVCRVLAALEQAGPLATVRRIVVWFRVHLYAFLGLLPAGDSIEAGHCRAILELASRPLGEIDEGAASPELLERELAWLEQQLGSAVHGPPAVSASGFAI